MGHEILAELEKVKIPGICDACQTLTVAWIKERKVFLKNEEYSRGQAKSTNLVCQLQGNILAKFFQNLIQVNKIR